MLKRCHLPGCEKVLPDRSGAAGRPRLYCCAGHRVRAAQLRAVERQALEAAAQLTQGYRLAEEGSTRRASAAEEKRQHIIDLAAKLAATARDLEKLTGPMIERTRKAMLARSEPPSHSELEMFEDVGRVRMRLHEEAAELSEQIACQE